MLWVSFQKERVKKITTFCLDIKDCTWLNSIEKFVIIFLAVVLCWKKTSKLLAIINNPENIKMKKKENIMNFSQDEKEKEKSFIK